MTQRIRKTRKQASPGRTRRAHSTSAERRRELNIERGKRYGHGKQD